MSTWHPAHISRTQKADGEMSYLLLEPKDPSVVKAYHHPGQYVRVRLGALEEGAFAIASAPTKDAPGFELLVKAGSPLSDALRAAKTGTQLELSAPEGPGFPIERAKGKRLLLFATGSGISAIRSVIDAVRRDRQAFGPVVLYFGVRTPDAFAYREELHSWEQAQIQVKTTVSRPGRSGWQGLKGYVQAHLDQEPLTDAVAFLCGQPEMVAGVTQALLSRGLAPNQVFLNV
jgi:NAD(P)H-flavin reductase